MEGVTGATGHLLYFLLEVNTVLGQVKCNALVVF